MTVRVLAALLVVALVTGCAGTPARTARDSGGEPGNRKILVTVRQTASLALGLTGTPGQRYQQRRYGPSPTVERTLSQIAHDHSLERVEGWAIQSLSVYCEVLEVADGRSVEDAVRELKADPRVELAQPMNYFDTQTSRYDDPYVDLQSSALELDVEDAHELATGRGVSIAIIDSAIDGNHPDLRGRIRLARDLVDDDRRGARAGEVHGTAVAGIIASTANNRVGIVGVAPDADIAALRACWAVDKNSVAARCSSFSLARALEIAVELKPNVINLSLAGPDDPLLGRLLDEIIDRGIIVVAALPETSASSAALSFPASHPKVLAAHSAADPLANDSPFHIGAPASEIITTTPGASYAFLSGNSLAAAHTTGVVALLIERDPTLDAEKIAALLTDTSTYSPGVSSINACRALERLSGKTLCTHGFQLARF
jgi:subtilisin family serine protease